MRGKGKAQAFVDAVRTNAAPEPERTFEDYLAEMLFEHARVVRIHNCREWAKAFPHVRSRWRSLARKTMEHAHKMPFGMDAELCRRADAKVRAALAGEGAK